MPAPRTCRDCGATLPTSIPWCSLCFAPVVAFSARPLVPAPIVGGHRLDHDPAGHWCRWHKSATTMGPRGRLLATGVITCWLIAGFLFEFFLMWIFQLALLLWILAGVWANGWAVPAAPNGPRVPLTPDERRSLMPRYADWRDASRRSRVLTVVGIVLIVAFSTVWSTGDNTRQGIMAMALVVGIGVPVLYLLVRPA